MIGERYPMGDGVFVVVYKEDKTRWAISHDGLVYEDEYDTIWRNRGEIKNYRMNSDIAKGKADTQTRYRFRKALLKKAIESF